MFSFRYKILLFGLFVFGFQQCVRSQDFTYAGNLGPAHWGEQYNTCDGKFQSPINIDLLNVQKVLFPSLVFEGFDERARRADIKNNGHTVLVTMDYDGQQPLPTVSGGPLNDSYGFTQFHFHWGENDSHGSEDLINNHSFPVELHMVFHKVKYNNFTNAVRYPDGVLVLAFFYELDKDTNPTYNELTSLIEIIVKPDAHVGLLNPPKLEEFITKNLQQYFTYSGSLTTPPCNEVVTWIDFEIPIPISSEQIRNFRNIYTHQNEKLTHNFRPIQPLNGRIVYHNHPEHHLITTQRTIPGIDDNINNDLSDEQINNRVLPVKTTHNDYDNGNDEIDNKSILKKNRKLIKNSSMKISISLEIVAILLLTSIGSY